MSLSGKRILIDPGHGGEEFGAVGPGGLKEKDVNLSVALFLRDMLAEAGAEVMMTREGDQTVPRWERRDMANALRPDAYVAIHHNAMPDEFTNRVEVYYPWVAQGPSVDLAWIAVQNLAKAMGLPHRNPLPSKYTVMQIDVEPAILTEASYIADPREEMLLRNERRRISEAKAIFDSLKHYFEAPGPVVKSVEVAEGKIVIRVDGEIEPLYSMVRVSNHEPIFEVSPDGLSVYLPFLPNGLHSAECVVRNRWGRSSRLVRHEFMVKRPAAAFAASVFPPIVPYRTEAPLLLTIEVLDHYGMPVADGTPVEVEILEASGEAVRESFTTRSGAVLYPWRTNATSARIRLSAGRAQRVIPIQIRRDSRYAMFVGEIIPPGRNVRVRYKSHTFPALGGRYFWISHPGGISGDIEVWAVGYKPQIIDLDIPPGSSDFQQIVLEPMQGGLLLDRRFYIDIGDPRLMPVATELKHLLSFHGAIVRMSQTTQITWAPEEHSAWEAQEFGCEVLVSLDARPRRQVKYYYLDKKGSALAEIIKSELDALGHEYEMTESGQYILIHPDGARVAVHLPVDGDFSGIAEAIFKGILNYAVIEFSS
jgi:N-acetylmuramoyl-L-alanine amidase